MQSTKVNPVKIAEFCADILTKELKIKVYVLPETDNPFEANYLTSAPDYNTFALNDRGAQVRVIPFKVPFWINFRIKFEVSRVTARKADFSFAGVSISVFEGSLVSEDKNLIFRAEWDNKLDNVLHPHPHWHMNTGKAELSNLYGKDFIEYLSVFKKERLKFSPESDDVEHLKLNYVDLNKFHFAMNAFWRSEGDHIHILNENVLRIWLKGCLKHIGEQLVYCIGE